jgi:hypothetical protein
MRWVGYVEDMGEDGGIAYTVSMGKQERKKRIGKYGSQCKKLKSILRD